MFALNCAILLVQILLNSRAMRPTRGRREGITVELNVKWMRMEPALACGAFGSFSRDNFQVLTHFFFSLFPRHSAFVGRTQNSRKREKFPLEICGGIFILRILNSAGRAGECAHKLYYSLDERKREQYFSLISPKSFFLLQSSSVNACIALVHIHRLEVCGARSRDSFTREKLQLDWLRDAKVEEIYFEASKALSFLWLLHSLGYPDAVMHIPHSDIKY